ncbi:MAG: hypothetical protein K6T30_05580 [Alicyclobacillus sp.]|nr:hypothetical protein [Alicyclobacillus sp.]
MTALLFTGTVAGLVRGSIAWLIGCAAGALWVSVIAETRKTGRTNPPLQASPAPSQESPNPGGLTASQPPDGEPRQDG